MAMSLEFFPGYKDGTEQLSAAVTGSYVGGMLIGAFADGVGVTLSGANVLGMSLNDKIVDAQNGKVAFAPRGSKATLSPSLSPALDKLIITKGISAGAASMGDSNNKQFARSLPVSTSNPAYPYLDPTDLGVTKVYPYDESKSYAPGNPLFINATSGKLTNVTGDSDGKQVGLVVRAAATGAGAGDALTVVI